MATINEAVLYLSLLPPGSERFVVMRRDMHPKSGETVAEYYYRTYGHLLSGVRILEIDPALGTVRELGSHASWR